MEQSDSDLPSHARAKSGRKRKVDTSVEEVNSFPEMNISADGTSRRGRRRKQINYYELVNPEAHSTDENKKKSLETGPKSSPLKTTSNGSTNKKQVNGVEKEEYILPEGIIVAKTSSSPHPTKKNEEKAKSRKTPKADSEDSLEAAKKYNHTGETVKLLSTLFNHFKDNPAVAGDESPAKSDERPLVEEQFSESSTGVVIMPRKGNKAKPKDYEIKAAEAKSTDVVTCAVCNAILDRTSWIYHKQRFHNNLAWRLGEEPLDLSDQDFVLTTLNALYKKKKPLYCDKCGDVKKSVVGFLSHQSICKKFGQQLEDIKISCEVCGKRMLPVSLTSHMKMLHKSKKKNSAEKLKEISSESLSSKRGAARKALQVIESATRNVTNLDKHYTTNLRFTNQNFAKTVIQNAIDLNGKSECKFDDCDFASSSVIDMLNHLEGCPKRPRNGYACKECLIVTSTLGEMIVHVELIHDLKVQVPHEDDKDEAKYTMKRPACIAHTSWVSRTHRGLFVSAFDWTFDFQQNNFSATIFEHFQCRQSDWLLLPLNSVDEYLPKLCESCDVSRLSVKSFVIPPPQEFVFKKFKLFESELHADGKYTVFCGGPVSALAWLPTPHTKTNENQVLAVAVLKSPDDKYLCHDNYSVTGAIQFWNFAQLRNKDRPTAKPQLVFNLAHDHGPIWDLKWCPSGVYADRRMRFSRMGLLACAGSHPAVYIYAIPHPTENEEGLHYKARPVLKLLLQRPASPLLGGLKYYPRRITWSKAAGHSHIAVGYTNGFVGMYNLTTQSFILKQKDHTDGVTYILPYKCFQAHSHAITAISLHHLNGGGRWLVTGSLDRSNLVWDVENPDYPICSVKKNIVTDGFWFTNWICHAMAQDEGSTSLYVTTTLKQSRDFLCEASMNITCSPSTILSITGSDWLNGLIQANACGELIAIFPQQMLSITDSSRIMKKKRWLFGYTHLVDKRWSPQERYDFDKNKKNSINKDLTDKSQKGLKLSQVHANVDTEMFCNEPIVYEQAEDRYGLLYCDNPMESYDDFPESTSNQLLPFSKSFNFTQPNQYPMTAANVVEFNPNRQASLFYATGYQVGFLRVSWLNFLKNDPQIK